MPALLAARFALELAMVAAFARVGWQAGGAMPVSLVLALLLPLAAATVWGLLLSPKARLTVPLPARLVLELALFAAAAGGLWWAGAPGWALALGLGELVVLGALVATGHPPGPAATDPE